MTDRTKNWRFNGFAFFLLVAASMVFWGYVSYKIISFFV